MSSIQTPANTASTGSTTPAAAAKNGTTAHNGHIDGDDYGNPPPLGNPFFAQMLGIPPPPPLDPPMMDYRAHSLAQPFNLVERFKTGKPSLGFGLLLGSPALARIVGAAGYDWVMIDWEHTPMSIREVTELIKWVQYASEGRTAAVVRVPNGDHQWIAWCLDAGASAVMLPHVETAEQARAFVQSAKFPNARSLETPGRFWLTPQGKGKRSFPPVALTFGINDGVPPNKMPFDVWNQAACILQIESELGAQNAAEIAAVEGVDCLMVGNGDLRMDLGLPPGLDGPEESFNRCLKQIVDAGKKYDRPVLTFTAGPGGITDKLKQGFSAFMVGSDSFAVATGMRVTLKQSYDEVEEWKKAGSKVSGWA